MRMKKVLLHGAAVLGSAAVVFGMASGIATAATGNRMAPGSAYAGGLSKADLAAAAELRRLDPSAPVAVELSLGPLAPLEKAGLAEPRFAQPLQVGVERALPFAFAARMGPTHFGWEEARAGGQVAIFAIRSEGARAVRAAIEFHSLPAAAEVRYFEPGGKQVMGPYEATFVREEPGEAFWSPMIQGGSLGVEIYLPRGADPEAVVLSVVYVSHLVDSPLDQSFFKDIGDAGGCHKDVACRRKWRNTGDAVALIAYQQGGRSFVCTGQLMNDTDPDTSRLIFSTAAHCIQKKKVARSATFLWFFQRATCGGGDPTELFQTGVEPICASPPSRRARVVPQTSLCSSCDEILPRASTSLAGPAPKSSTSGRSGAFTILQPISRSSAQDVQRTSCSLRTTRSSLNSPSHTLWWSGRRA